MAIRAEILIYDGIAVSGRRMLTALEATARSAGIIPSQTRRYQGKSEWLVLWGIGGEGRSDMRDRHIEGGGHVIMWDTGYLKSALKLDGFCRPSIDQDYPVRWLDGTTPDPHRWASFNLPLREDFNSAGHIIISGIGPKQHAYMRGRIDTWEQDKLTELRRRFPGRRIVYRPKPGRQFVPLDCETDDKSSIEQVLQGAALVCCFHSSVAVDAIVAGVPYEAEEGAATWLLDKPFTTENRLDFMRRLAWWQWRPSEAPQVWDFFKQVLKGVK
jgi:hypothetical protein